MKKNHNLQGGAGCLLLASLLFLPSCALRKKTTQKETIRKETIFQQADSLQLVHRINQKQQFVIHRDEIHLSTPDSNGRQHITALILNRISQQSQSTEQDSLSTQSSQQTLQKEKTVKQFKQSSVPPFSIPRWLWFVCLLLSLFLLKRKEF